MTRRGFAARVLGVAAVVVLALTPARATETQKVRGRVNVPSPGIDCGIHAFEEAVLMTAARQQAYFSYSFVVSRASWGRRFTLTSDLPADLDLYFDRGTFTSVGTEGERGRVPYGARRATVCLAAGAPTAFTYRAR